MTSVIKKILEQATLSNRLRVLFEMEWLTININPDREATDKEIQKAAEWAERMTKNTVNIVTEWQNDGSGLM
jgi:predicted nuclease of predicted toxin-antitoxin system